MSRLSWPFWYLSVRLVGWSVFSLRTVRWYCPFSSVPWVLAQRECLLGLQMQQVQTLPPEILSAVPSEGGRGSRAQPGTMAKSMGSQARRICLEPGLAIH